MRSASSNMEASSASRSRFSGKPAHAPGVSHGGHLVKGGMGNWEALAASLGPDKYGGSVQLNDDLRAAEFRGGDAD
ncbi:MAG TPA: hypothetical protein VLI55_12425 [Bryobacteraceae bacterium]|nr:hypothetical protein [Bryobacteraceae bacterium]